MIYSAFTANFAEHTHSFQQTFTYRQPFSSIIHILIHMHNFGKNEWTFPGDSVGFCMGVDAWLSLSINVPVNQMTSPYHQTHKEPVQPKWQETLQLLASRLKLCNNCSILMNSNPELLHPVISKQRAYFSFKCSLWYFSREEKHHYETEVKFNHDLLFIGYFFWHCFGNSSWIHQHDKKLLPVLSAAPALSELSSKGSVCLLWLHELQLSSCQLELLLHQSCSVFLKYCMVYGDH